VSDGMGILATVGFDLAHGPNQGYVANIGDFGSKINMVKRTPLPPVHCSRALAFFQVWSGSNHIMRLTSVAVHSHGRGAAGSVRPLVSQDPEATAPDSACVLRPLRVNARYKP